MRNQEYQEFNGLDKKTKKAKKVQNKKSARQKNSKTPKFFYMVGFLVNLSAVTGMVVVKQWEKRMKEEGR